MKKWIMMFMLFVLFPFVSVYAKENVEVSNLSCKTSIEGVEWSVHSEVTNYDIRIDDVRFTTLGDYLECTFDITNNQTEDIYLNEDGLKENRNENLEYKLTYNDDKVIKPNTTKTYSLQVTYNKLATKDLEINNSIKLNILEHKSETDSGPVEDPAEGTVDGSTDSSVDSPKTGDSIYIYGITLVVSMVGLALVTYLLLKHNKISKKTIKMTSLIVLPLLAITTMISVKAAMGITLNISNKIVVAPIVHKLTILENGQEKEVLELRYLDDTTISISDKEGYTLKVKQDGNELSTTDEKIFFEMGKEDSEINIEYTPIEYKITYDLDGGTLENEVAKYTIENDDITLETPTKDGYTFVGWQDENDVIVNNVIIKKGSMGSKSYKAIYTRIVSILGDSISTLKGYIPSQNRARYVQVPSEATGGLIYMPYEETWWGQVINENSFSLGINESWAGSTVFNNASSNSGDIGPDAAMASMTRIGHLDDNGTPNIILFYGGTNDIGRNIPLGTFDPNASYVTTLDTTSKTYNNFVEAYTIAIKRMMHLYPDAEIISILPTYTKSYYTTERLLKYNSEIEKICDYFNIKYVRLNNSGITISDLADGIHPNNVGMDKISTYISKVMNNEVEEDTKANSHAQELPVGLAPDTNLWTELTPEKEYYNGTSWASDYYSITVPVEYGDKITATAFKEKTVNGGSVDGIRVTYFDGEKVVVSKTPSEIYQEYSTNAYIVVPEGVNYVNIPVWKNDTDTFKNVVHLMKDGEEEASANSHAQELPDALTPDTNLWTALTPRKEYYSGTSWTNNYYSITIPVEYGDKITATAFKEKTVNGGSMDGIRVTYFDGEKVVVSKTPLEIYQEYSTNGYITVPEGVNYVNIPVWKNDTETFKNVIYLMKS